jgi:beta-phosphoglucomutase-like phosphatase (HAD superfamily)
MINEFNFDDRKSIDLPLGFSMFCDLDGTLVDTDYANYLSYRRALIEVTSGMYDVDFRNERLNRESLKRRLPSLTDAQLELITSLKSWYFKGFLSETRLNTELAELITSYHGKNQMVLVTYCREMRAMEVLRHHELLECFTRIICREALLLGGSSNKYEHAITLMGVSREAILIFEDENIGIEQAIIAGVPSGNIYKVFSRVE